MAMFEGSKYTKTKLNMSDYGIPILCTRNRSSFDPMKATYYTVLETDTLDMIAFRKYGNPVLSWAIMDANPLYSCELDILPGDIIMLPAYDEVMSYV